MGVLVLGAGAAVLGSQLFDEAPKRDGIPQQEGLVRFEDKPRDLSISYPATWQRVPSSDPEVPLIAGTPEASMLMRRTRLGAKVFPETLERARKITDRLVMREKGAKQLRPPRRIENLGGLPGWLYIYSFNDPVSKGRGAHAHYFLFQGEHLISLVFQTLPSERFATYAPLFDRLANTFEADPTA